METIVMTTLAAVLITAVWTDLRSSRIPNWLTVSCASVGIATHAWCEGLQGTLFSLSGLGLGLGLFLVPYMSGGIGAGDVKLMGAVGALLGPHGVLISAFLATMVGGGYALGMMIYHWGMRATGQKMAFAIHGALLTGYTAPAKSSALPFRLRYGLAIAGGTILFVLNLHPFRG